LKSEDAQAAAAAATNKAMKRLISLALVIVFIICLSACAPNNVLTPDTPDTPDTPPQQTVPQPDPAPQSPDTPADTEADTTETLKYVDAAKKQNNAVMPTVDIAALGLAPKTLAELKDVKLTVYTAERTAFTVDALDDKGWIDAVAEDLGIKVKQIMHSDKTLFSSQAIAQKSGMSLDVVSTLITDMIATSSLMSQALTLPENVETLPFSKRVFDMTGGKVFTGYGNSKMMWYNKEIVSDAKAYDLFMQGVWDTKALASIKTEVKAADKNMIECSNWASFGSANGVQATGLTPDGTLVCNLADEKVISSFKTFAELLDTVSTDKKTFKNGNTAFFCTDTPNAPKTQLGFVPVPSVSDGGATVSELCGVGMGVSKTASEEIAPAALTFILLWSARYSEARTDTLVFELKLDAKKADKYIEFAEQNGGIYNCDRIISAHFTSSSLPNELYGTAEVISEKYKQVFDRTLLLNNKL